MLLELQSRVDYRMPYRLLLYIVEILRYYYNQADVKEREKKDFKFPVVVPIIFFSGKDKWTVPLNLNDMFANADVFGKHVLNFEYMLVNAKGYKKEDLKNFRSKLLGTALLLEKAGNDVEFYTAVRENLDDIKGFDAEERRVINLCIKLMDSAYSYNKGEAINEMLEENNIQEVDKMLNDIIENAKREKEELLARGRSENALDVAKAMLAKKFPIDLIMELTKLSKKQIEESEHNMTYAAN